MLRCPKCGRTRTQDVQLQLDGFHCRNCLELVDVDDTTPNTMGRVPTDENGRP